MSRKWLKRCLAAYLLAMATCGGAWADLYYVNSPSATIYLDGTTTGFEDSTFGNGGTACFTNSNQTITIKPGTGDASVTEIAIDKTGFCDDSDIKVDNVTSGLTFISISYGGSGARLMITDSTGIGIKSVSDNLDTLLISNSRVDFSSLSGNVACKSITIILGTNNLSGSGDFAMKLKSTELASLLNNTSENKLTSIGVSGSGAKYSLIATEVDADADTASKLQAKFDGSLLNKYEVTIDGAGYFVTKSALKPDPDNPGGLKKVAMADSKANGGLADVILALNGNGSKEMQALLGEFEQYAMAHPGSAGRAVTELNGANAAVGNVRVSQSAAQQFNNAIGNVFADRLSRAVFNSSSAGGAPAGRESASAGGVPVTYRNFGATADACAEYQGWFKVYGGFGGVDGSSTAAGYDFGGVGVMTGIERQFGSELSLGALLGWSFNRSKIADDMGDATDNILRFGVYGNYQWNGFQFSTTPSLAIHMLENERNIHFLHATAQSERTGLDFNWLNKIAYGYEFCNGLVVTPSYALGVTYLHDPAHTEHGAGAANLHIRDCDNWSLTQNLELKLGKVFQINDRVALLPEIWGGWEHEYLSTNDVTMNFAAAANNSWSAPVEDIAANRAVLGAGVKTMLGDRWQIDARYDQKIWDGGYNTNFSLGASLKF